MSGPDRIFTSKCGNALVTDHLRWDDDKEYIRRDSAEIAALPEVQAIVADAVKAALDDVTTLHRVIADIRTETVGHKPMLSELAQALVQWRDAAVAADRDACAWLATSFIVGDPRNGIPLRFPSGVEVAAAIRKRGEG